MTVSEVSAPTAPHDRLASLEAQMLRDHLGGHVAWGNVEGFHLEPSRVAADQLERLQARFEDLRGRVAVLGRLAEEQGVEQITELNQAAVLAFPHTFYKSYPVSFIERGRWTALTRWLSGLTAVDLGDVDMAGVDSIDGWIDRLEALGRLDVVHTSGTSGKLSFLPRVRAVTATRSLLMAAQVRDWRGPGSGPDLLRDRLPLISPSYRHGRSSTYRSLDMAVQLYAGGDDNALCLYPDEFSADLASLAGRLQVAEARGELGAVMIPDSLLAKQEEFVRREREKPARMEAFFAEAQARFGGRDVFIISLLTVIFEWAEAGMARGYSGLFGARSALLMGGGSKGRTLPDNAREIIREFIGFSAFSENYAMTEMSGGAPKCDHGHYHLPPYIVPFVLDPETSRPLPRNGVRTGRFAFIDLIVDTHWGGFITGDRVTLHWPDAPCACGRPGVHIEDGIRRFTQLEGGDDKITCAGAPEAHDNAIAYLARLGN